MSTTMKKRILTILTLFCFFVTSCVEDVDVTNGQEKQVVVNCLLVNDTVQELTLNYSEPKFYTNFEPIVDAKVTLWVEDKFVGEFKVADNNKWYLKHKPIILKEYTLKVEVPGRKLIYATTTFPNKPSIRRVEENDTEESYCFVKRNHDIFWIFAIAAEFSRNPKPGSFYDKTQYLIHPIGCTLSNVDNFNIDDRHGTEYKHPMYYYYIRVLPESEDKEQYFDVSKITRVFTVFRGVSQEYDLYLKSALQRILLYKNNDDPNIIFDESVIYSNIVNGVGIFGACNDTEFCCAPASDIVT